MEETTESLRGGTLVLLSAIKVLPSNSRYGGPAGPVDFWSGQGARASRPSRSKPIGRMPMPHPNDLGCGRPARMVFRKTGGTPVPLGLCRPSYSQHTPANARVQGLRTFSGILLGLLCLAGCAGNPNSDILVDPLKQRLIAREDIALQNLLFARTPAYISSGSGGGSYSYVDAPYDGPAIEPPLPDLSLLPEDLPPWEEKLEPLPSVPAATPDPMTPPAPAPIPSPEVTPTPQP